jgi:hypothetical protein
LKELPFAALPPDIPPSLQQDNPELPPQGQAMADEEEEMIQDALLNHEEYEHLPGGPNESSGSSESEDAWTAELGGTYLGLSGQERCGNRSYKTLDRQKFPCEAQVKDHDLDYY